MRGDRVPVLLVVEDEPSVRLLLRVVLEGDGYRVLTAEDGSQAIEVLAAGEIPDLLVLDMYTPGAGAREVVAFARERAGAVPAIVLSGRDDAANAFPAGTIQGFISKPFDVGTLLAGARGALDMTPDRNAPTPVASSKTYDVEG